MATTVVYEGYEQDAFNREVEVSRAENPNGPRQSARLAPVHVPESVDFLLAPDGNAAIRFHYLNDEHPERRARQLANNPRVAVLLGRHTGKILQIIVQNAQSQLSEGRVSFDSAEASRWVDEFPPPRRWVVMRNAELAASILATMPERVRLALLEAFKTAPAGDARD